MCIVGRTLFPNLLSHSLLSPLPPSPLFEGERGVVEGGGGEKGEGKRGTPFHSYSVLQYLSTSIEYKTRIQLSTTDLLALASMKNAAKCDT